MDLIKDSHICIRCWIHVSKFYEIKTLCLKNEKRITDVLVEHGAQKTNIVIQERTESETDGNNEKAAKEIASFLKFMLDSVSFYLV